MKNILLICSAGMSTSLLVTKMKEAAELRRLKVHIWSVGQDQAVDEIKNADLLLFGPQLKFTMGKFEEQAKEQGIPIEDINPITYGKLDGEEVLNRAMELLTYSRE